MAAGTHSKCHARSGRRVGDVIASHKLRFCTLRWACTCSKTTAAPRRGCSMGSQSGRVANRLSHSLFLIFRFNPACPALHCIPFPFPIMAAVPECSRSVRAISCSCDVGSCVRPRWSALRVRPWPAPFRRPLAPGVVDGSTRIPFFSKSALCLSVRSARPDARSDPSAQKNPKFCLFSSRPFFAIRTHDIRRELNGPENIMGCPSPITIRMKSTVKVGGNLQVF